MDSTLHNTTLHNATLHKPIHILSPEILIKIVGVTAAFYGMAAHWEGLFSFTYFTNLSNLVIAGILLYALVGKLICAIDYGDHAHVRGALAEHTSGGLRFFIPQTLSTQAWYRVKYMATLAITITFLLYMCFLAPTSDAGFVGAYLNNHASSLCTHFIAPLCAIADFLLFDHGFKPQTHDVFWALLPPFVYIGYVCVLSLVFGVRWKTVMLAPYNFLNFGAPCGWFGIDVTTANTYTLGIGVFYFVCVFTLIFIAIGVCFLKIVERRAK